MTRGAIAYMAQALGIDLAHARQQDVRGNSINFAVSGARTGSAEGYYARKAVAKDTEPQPLIAPGMILQAKDSATRVAALELAPPQEDTIFFIAGGLNDGALTTDATISNIDRIISFIYSAGARYIVLAQLPVCIPPFSATAKRLNLAVPPLLSELRSKYPADHFDVSQWGVYFDDVITTPSRFGISNTREPCAGRTLFGEDPSPRGPPDTFFFYHEGHHRRRCTRLSAPRLRPNHMNGFFSARRKIQHMLKLADGYCYNP
jgi:phospholipase/lecithinase/hemolysin